MGGKAGLRIAYSNQKVKICCLIKFSSSEDIQWMIEYRTSLVLEQLTLIRIEDIFLA